MDGKSPPHSGIYNKQMVSLSNLNFSLYCDFWKMCFDLPTFYLRKKKLYNWLDLHGCDFDADRLPSLTASTPPHATPAQHSWKKKKKKSVLLLRHINII